MTIFHYIKADPFFKDYLPHIKNYKNKIRGKNGRGNPLAFTQAEEKEIRKAVKEIALSPSLTVNTLK